MRVAGHGDITQEDGFGLAGEERVAAEPEAALRIVRQCGLLPPAVSVTAARLRSRPVWDLADLAERLEREDATTSDIGGATFDVSYRDLPDRAKGLFRLLGIHPGFDFTASSVAAPAGLTPIEADRVLELLLDENLLHQSVAGRYGIHDLLRAYAAERPEAEMSEDERRTAVETVLRWFVAVLTLTTSALGVESVPPPLAPLLPPPWSRRRPPASSRPHAGTATSARTCCGPWPWRAAWGSIRSPGDCRSRWRSSRSSRGTSVSRPSAALRVWPRVRTHR